VKITRIEIVNEIRRVANQLGKDRLSRSEFRTNSVISLWHVDKLFDSWNEAMEEAGLVPVPRKTKIQENDLFIEMRRVFLDFGGICNRTRFSKRSRYSVDVYKKRFGRWNNVLKAFLNWLSLNGEAFPHLDQLASHINSRDRPFLGKTRQKTLQTARREVAPMPETELKKQAYSSLQQLELALNGLVQRQLSKLTNDWWKQRIPDDVRAEAQGRKDRDQKPWRWYEKRDLHLIHYLTFADYAKIISRKDNWRDAFAEMFGDKEMVLLRLRELEPIRNIVMHPSKPLSPEQLERLRLYAMDLITATSRTEKVS